MTCETGASGSMPAATTRVRRSRSVMIPSVASPASTTTHVAPRSAITRAASRIEVSGRAEHERPADELGDRPLRGVDRGLLAVVAAEGLQQRARHVAQARRPRQQRPRRPPRGCGSRASPRPRSPRSRSAGPRASRRARTARPARPGRARGRRGRSRPRRSAPPRRARPARRPAGRSPCPPGGTRPRPPRPRARRPRARASRTAGGARGSRRRPATGEIYQFLDTVRWREDTRGQLDPALSEGGRNG